MVSLVLNSEETQTNQNEISPASAKPTARQAAKKHKKAQKKPHAKQTSSVVRQTPDYGGQVAPSPPLATSAKDAKTRPHRYAKRCGRGAKGRKRGGQADYPQSLITYTSSPRRLGPFDTLLSCSGQALHRPFRCR